MKAHVESAIIPVIFVTALSDNDDEVRGFEAGGVDFIKKPISANIVRVRVVTQITLYNSRKECEIAIEKRTKELEISNRAAVAMLAEAGHYNDTDTGVHVWRMAAYTGALGRASGWSIERSKILELAAAMHDTGKIGIPDSILKKPARLTSDEFDVIKTHTTIGHSILHIKEKRSQLFTYAAEIALNHHEKWDGSGYPIGLVGEAIPESARIAAITDVFDALTMKRPYKDEWPIEKAFAEIERGRGSHFDPHLVDLFLELRAEILELKGIWDNKGENYDWFHDEDEDVFIDII